MAKRHFSNYIRRVTNHSSGDCPLLQPTCCGPRSLEETLVCIGSGYGCEHPRQVPARGPGPYPPCTDYLPLGTPVEVHWSGRGAQLPLSSATAQMGTLRKVDPLGGSRVFPLDLIGLGGGMAPRRTTTRSHWDCPSWSLGAPPGPAGQWWGASRPMFPPQPSLALQEGM